VRIHQVSRCDVSRSHARSAGLIGSHVPTTRLVALLAAAALAGCRATPSGLGLAALRDGIRLADVREIEKELVGRPVEEADRKLGERAFVRHDELSGDELIFYPLWSLPAMDHFHVARINASGEITAISGWLKNADGLEDLIKLGFIKRKVVGRTVDEARERAKLAEPNLILTEEGRPERFFIFDVTNFTHILPRVMQLTIGEDGRCVRAEYFGAISRWTAEPVEQASERDDAAQPPDPSSAESDVGKAENVSSEEGIR